MKIPLNRTLNIKRAHQKNNKIMTKAPNHQQKAKIQKTMASNPSSSLTSTSVVTSRSA